MGAVTGWVVLTWVTITAALGLGFGCSGTARAGPIAALVAAALAEIWAVKAPAWEWVAEARTWWWWTG